MKFLNSLYRHFKAMTSRQLFVVHATELAAQTKRLPNLDKSLRYWGIPTHARVQIDSLNSERLDLQMCPTDYTFPRCLESRSGVVHSIDAVLITSMTDIQPDCSELTALPSSGRNDGSFIASVIHEGPVLAFSTLIRECEKFTDVVKLWTSRTAEKSSTGPNEINESLSESRCEDDASKITPHDSTVTSGTFTITIKLDSECKTVIIGGAVVNRESRTRVANGSSLSSAEPTFTGCGYTPSSARPATHYTVIDGVTTVDNPAVVSMCKDAQPMFPENHAAHRPGTPIQPSRTRIAVDAQGSAFGEPVPTASEAASDDYATWFLDYAPSPEVECGDRHDNSRQDALWSTFTSWLACARTVPKYRQSALNEIAIKYAMLGCDRTNECVKAGTNGDWFECMHALHAIASHLDINCEYSSDVPSAACLVETVKGKSIHVRRDLNRLLWPWALGHELGHAVLFHVPDPSYGTERRSDSFSETCVFGRQEAEANCLAALFIGNIERIRRFRVNDRIRKCPNEEINAQDSNNNLDSSSCSSHSERYEMYFLHVSRDAGS